MNYRVASIVMASSHAKAYLKASVREIMIKDEVFS